MTLAVNPFLPSWEYIPDGEPHVFGDRLYLFGSHDRFDGRKFCQNDYVVWSAPIDDLGDWRCEGVSYRRTQDPTNADGKYELWAPDVAHGPDGRYYLYYCLANRPAIGVAVADTPAGPYAFLGHVHNAQGRVLGQRDGDTLVFDPAVLVENGQVWLYSGNGPMRLGMDRKHRKASVVAELEPDMVTLKTEPRKLVPTLTDSAGTSFAGHEFFEASSIRTFAGRYYFIYSSALSHELCWAVSDRPDRGFTYGGTLVSNGDLGLDGTSAKVNYNAKASPAMKNYIGNNHGSVVEIGGQYFVFYHRQTNRRGYSRQACAEQIELDADGRFHQARLTSSGLHAGPLPGVGRYEARIACHLGSRDGAVFSAHPLVQNRKHPAFTQSPPDREADPDQHIENLRDGAFAGFRSFDFGGADTISATVRGKAEGQLVVRDERAGAVVAELAVRPSSAWHVVSAPLRIADGVRPLYFTYQGKGAVDFLDFTLNRTGA